VWLALGKECLCRVPEIWPSAKPQALGKARVFSSVGYSLLSYSKKRTIPYYLN